MLILLKMYWRQAAIVGCALLLAYAIKRYGTIEYENGATDEKVQVTKDLEKNVQMRYAAEVKQLEASKAQLAIDQGDEAFGYRYRLERKYHRCEQNSR